MKGLLLFFMFFFLLVCGCQKKENPANPVQNDDSEEVIQNDASGTFLYEKVGGSIHQFTVRTGNDTKLMDGTFPEKTKSGLILYVLDYPNRLMLAEESGLNVTTFVQDENRHFESPQSSYDMFRVAVQNLFSSSVNNINSGTVVYSGNGSLVKLLDDYYHPNWTPDGRLVLSGSYYSVFMPQTGSHPGIYITDKNLDNLHRIDPNLTDPLMPSVSPDGTKIAFILQKHVWVMNIDGSNLFQVTESSSEETYPSWSRNGNFIYFNYYSGGTKMAIVPADRKTNVTSNSACIIYTKTKETLNSANEINNW